eukprot:m51a1_g6126 hypothetical protein (73) ;mRNA; r:200819-208690
MPNTTTRTPSPCRTDGDGDGDSSDGSVDLCDPQRRRRPCPSKPELPWLLPPRVLAPVAAADQAPLDAARCSL